jgi:hypothetical protein
MSKDIIIKKYATTNIYKILPLLGLIIIDFMTFDISKNMAILVLLSFENPLGLLGLWFLLPLIGINLTLLYFAQREIYINVCAAGIEIKYCNKYIFKDSIRSYDISYSDITDFSWNLWAKHPDLTIHYQKQGFITTRKLSPERIDEFEDLLTELTNRTGLNTSKT